MSKQTDFIAKITPMAVADMQATGILASMTIAQAILESAWGKSGLTKQANNLFGIKGDGALSKTFEYINGKRIDIVLGFKKYPSWQESVDDHSALFLRYDRYKNLRGCKDYKAACRYVQMDGYATAPNYADSLIALIEQYKLYESDGVKIQKYPFTSNLKLGSKGADVALLQQRLNELGYSAGAVDGIFGEKTRAAVNSYQTGLGLDCDGIVGKNTWAKLFL